MVDGYVVDVRGAREIVEIQTRGFFKLRKKLTALAPTYRIRIVHPIAVETTINKLAESGELLSSRRSPRHGREEDVFREIVSLADLLPHRNVTVEVVMIRAVETRIADGKGSWRRRGVSIVARQLAEILSEREFQSAADYLRILPKGIAEPFSNRDLMAAAGLSYRQVQPITSSLRKMGLLEVVERRSRESLYATTRLARDAVH